MHDFESAIPIYQQIIAIFRSKIISGQLAAGDQLPAVREAAMEYKINPNTVQKAFVEMDRMGLTKSEGTSGRYVVASDELIAALRQQQAKEAVKEFAQRMQALGFSCESSSLMLREGWMDDSGS